VAEVSINSFTTGLQIEVEPAGPPMRRAPAPGGVPQASRHPAPMPGWRLASGAMPWYLLPSLELSTCSSCWCCWVLADARAPAMQLPSARCLLSIDWVQLGLPSDHTREHLVKQVPLSCLFSVLREEAARETRGPAPRRVLGSGLAYQVRGDTDAPAVGTRCRCAPACHQ
jgi:hypothetical protein